MERDERTSSIAPAGIMAMACRQRRPDATREAPAVIAVGINWQLVRDRLGRMGWRRGSKYQRNRVTPVEERDLSERRTQEATKDRGIGDEPNNSTECSEVADGVARKSEGIAQISFLCGVRQGVSEGCFGIRLRTLRSQRRSSGSRQPDFRGHRAVWHGAMVGRTDARAEKSNLSTATRAAGVHTQTGWEAETVRDTDNPGSGCANGGSAGSGAYLRGRPAAGAVCLSGRSQRTGRRTTRPQADQCRTWTDRGC